jgi:hypothetical protein
LGKKFEEYEKKLKQWEAEDYDTSERLGGNIKNGLRLRSRNRE